MNIYDFIDKYKDISFKDKGLCELDLLIFSQLSYVDFDDVDFSKIKRYCLKDILKFTKTNVRNIPVQINALNLLRNIANTNRYKDVLLYNYKHICDTDIQFSAITLKTPDKQIIVSFEGTDNSIIGWREDANFSWEFPTPAQKEAGKYLNKLLNKIHKKIIICGHSKGGNLALTGSLNTSFFKKRKIKKIYSFDGPGIRKEEFTSFNYKIIKNKLKNIIPNQSMIGVLLFQENLDTIKSNEKGISQHSIYTWQIDDDKLLRTDRSKKSIEFESIMSTWIEKYSYIERKQLVDYIFSLFDKAKIKMLCDFSENKISSLCSMIKASTNMDSETKLFVFQCLKTLIGDTNAKVINDEISNLKSKLKKIYLKN